MRLGILFFGTDMPDVTVLDALSERDVDLVRAEAAVTAFVGAKAEAERIHRADCDGVALIIGEDADARHVAHAAQFIGVPLLLVAVPNDAYFDACGALAEAGIAFSRVALSPSHEESRTEPGDRNAQVEILERWLTSRLKTARQAGFEAASKLYGQILYVPSASSVNVDTAQWRQQFGITIVFGSGNEANSADIVAEDGNANRALCRHLLRLVSAEEPVHYRFGEAIDTDKTFAQLYRVNGRFHLLAFFTDSRTAFGTFLSREWLSVQLFDSEVYAVSGDRVPALRAACESLDISFSFH